MVSSDSNDDYYATKKRQKLVKRPCAYLKTVDRFCLDFDFEKVCSVTLSNLNVYACLVCGKYFTGRGKGTPAQIHSLEHDHYVFISLVDEKVYCLPECYEVDDGGELDDIRSNLSPKYSKADVAQIPITAMSLTGVLYLPGLVGLNLIRDSSYLTSVVHVLCAVAPFRDYFLTLVVPQSNSKTVTGSLSDLLKKICNPHNFKGLVSPHEFLHAVDTVSSNKFSSRHNDPVKFFNWLLDSLRAESGPVPSKPVQMFSPTIELELPPMPVFKEQGASIIPTVQLTDLLAEGNIPLSDYVLMRINRFVKNDFFVEKINTIVRFPLKGLMLNSGDISYSLCGVICHDGLKPCEGTFRAFVQYPQTGQWCECNGLRVSKVLPESVALVESYALLWRRDNIDR